ncbi:Acyltransferase [Phytophthora infestans]|uniref:Acyltransferase n=1 Tax=Phytophthora infestans TaxID=4787 RepID=A0A833S557_PHYIN|nr:Acyltransferase [Phytophthora infestans]
MSRSHKCQATQTSVYPTKRCDSGPVVEPDAEPVLNRVIHPSTNFETAWTWSGCIIGCSYLLLLVVCAFLNTTSVLWPLTLLQWSHLLSTRSCRWICRFLEDKYFAMLSGYVELVGGVKIIITGDEELQFTPHEHVLLICNHRSEVDWIFFWNLALRLNVHDRIRVMMKSVIRYAPGVGWTMMLLRYPYINRNWTTDQDRLNKVIESYKDVDMGTWLAMFPEGTALYDKTLKKSHEFASKQGEAKWNYVLQPRVKGFELCMDKMDPDYVVDLTVAYPELIEGVRPSPMRFVRGQFPTEVHMHVQRYHRSTLLKHKDRMGQWLKDRFAEKEERLERFYETGAFQGEQCVRQDLPVWSSVLPGIAVNLGFCGIALYWLINFPLAACTSFAISAALSMIQARNFGN